MEQARKLGIGARIAQARERSRWTQEDIATHLGITTRGYQKVEQKGTSSFERCEELAEFLDVNGVTAEWLWEEAGPGPTPDVMGLLGEPVSRDELDDRLERIESALQLLLADRGLELDAPQSERGSQQHTGS